MKLRKITTNKKAQFDIFKLIIIPFIIVVMFAGLIWIMGSLNDVFSQIGLANEVNAGQEGYVNMSLASEQIWGQAYQSIQALRMVAVVYILALAILIILTGAFERRHPILFFVYILIALLAVIFSPTVSNAYEDLLASNIFDGELANFTASNFIIQNLPTIVLVVSIFGAIFLAINIIRGGAEENIG